MAERAYALYSGWVTPPRRGMTDISVDDFTIGCLHSAPPGCRPRRLWTRATPSSGSELHLSACRPGLPHHRARGLSPLRETPLHRRHTDPWLQEGLAEWAAVRADSAAGGLELNPDRTMDCVGSECGDSEFDRNGYPGWMLFEYLAERFGDASGQVCARCGCGQSRLDRDAVLSSVVQPLSPTLGKFFEDYTTARLTGNFTFAALAGVLPKTQGYDRGRFVDRRHLAGDTRRQPPRRSLRRPRARTGHRYGPLLLGLARPQGHASGRRRLHAVLLRECEGLCPAGLHGLGQHRDANDIPWNTCGASPHAYVSLPNESNDVARPALDGREFTVSGTVTVDKTKPASASEAPAGVKVTGPVIQTPTSDPAPELTLHAPELIRVSAKTRLLRFIVFSSGDGTLKATLGSTWLGSAGLHAGNNDVRYILPTRLLKSLRKTNTPANVLTLTSYSPGGTQGASVTRRVAMKPVPKPKPKKRSK